MKNEYLSLDDIYEHAETIFIVLGKWLGMIENEVGLLNLTEELQNWIIDKSVKYAIAIDCDDMSFEDCFKSKEINNLPAYIVPDTFRDKANDRINTLIESYKQKDGTKIFHIDPANNLGRLSLLEKTIKYQIKLLHKEYLKNVNDPNLPIGLSFMPFEKEIDFKFDTIINNAIKYIICLENKDTDSEMRSELMSKDYAGKDGYRYCLEKHVNNIIESSVENFLNTYLKKETDLTGMSFEDSRDALLRTIDNAENDINEIFSYELYSKNKECILIHNNYLALFEQSKQRISVNATLKPFRNMLKKAKMNYVMKHKEEYIYPFVYDLLIIDFLLLMKTTVYKEELTSPRSMARKINEFKNTFFTDKSFDENYFHEEFLQLADILPENFNNYTGLIIKHYSEILDTNYNHIASVLRQLRFAVADGNKGIYKITKDLKTIDLSIDEDHFRLLSLDII